MEIIWTSSKLEHAICERLFFYENLYSRRLEEIPFNRSLALGIFLHKIAEKFWIKDKYGLIIPRYKSKEAFVNSASANFKYNVIRTGEIQGRRIEWKDEEEKWMTLGEMINISKNFWDKCMEGGPPLLVEQKFKLRINRLGFSGRIDELRKDPNEEYLVVIRDHKSGRRHPRDMELEYYLQFTLYVLGVGCLAHKNKEFADILGISDEERARLGGNPIYLDDRIKVEYHHMRTGEIFTTTRSDVHYQDLMPWIYDVNERIIKRIEERDILYPKDFPPNRRHCDYCYASKLCHVHTQGIRKPYPTEVTYDPVINFEFEDKLVVPNVKLKTIQPKKKPVRKKDRKQKSLDLEFL